ncbi:pyrroline-5-carboxylate reductase [Rubripirellula sp.]|jgi:pyrroline-5-carboxylate reductase|nr:pyrroline-5-carboxylate reductase [Planctomycetaceae bacterium]MDA9858697.1 pyrroline-5-carboxylate reductase [Rubripirellula sp.]MDF1840339.1 pyrroline-5-carboxylate reductase [Rubripirellula sp.]
MSKITLAVVGGGQMGRALVGGMLASQVVQESSIRLVEPSQDSKNWWCEHYPEVSIEQLETAVSASDVILLAVKPNVIASVAIQTPSLWEGKLVISIAAGISLQQLSDWIGHQRVVRVMPNTPSLVRAGASGFCCGNESTPQDRETIQAMLDSVGLAVEVEESQLEGVTGLSGSGPAYVCMMIEALADGGVLAGLPRPLAMQLATQTVLGTAQMIEKTGQHPGQLKDAVASPGGTTIAAISVLEQNGLRGALIEAVAASANRSRFMGRDEK